MNSREDWLAWAGTLTPETVDCVAIKVVNPRHADTVEDEMAVHDALRQSQQPAPQIARLIDSFAVGGHPCLVSEMFGEELGAFVDEWELDMADARRASRDILLGLQSLHDLGIAHTDLKPPNVLFSPSERGAKLIDFSTATTQFRLGRHFGTREYRAPEVLLGGPWDTGVDVWSAACTLFEIVTGDLLFNAHRKARQVRPWLWKKAQIQFDAYRRVRALAQGGGTGSTTEEIDSAEPAAPTNPESPGSLFYRRSILDGRYILVSELGSGHFSTVWKAVRLPDHLKVIADDTEQEEASLSGPPSTVALQSSHSGRSSTSSPDCPYQWERLYNRCVNFAHFLTIQECLGPYPIKLAKRGQYYRAFYTRRKRLKFNPRLRLRSLEQRLVQDHAFAPVDAASFGSFLAPMLTYDPSARATVETCLQHPWLRGI